MLNKKNCPLAIDDYTKALDIDPDCLNALVGRARVFYELVQYEKNILDYSQALRLDSKNQVAYRIRGSCYSQLGKMDKAFDDFSKALELDPKDGLIYFVRGTAHEKMKQYQLAVDDYTSAMATTPRLAKFCRQIRADLYKKLGKPQLKEDSQQQADETSATEDASDFSSDVLDQEVVDDKILAGLVCHGCQLDKERNIDHKFCSARINLEALLEAIKKRGLLVAPNGITDMSGSADWVTVLCHERAPANYMPQRTPQLIRLAYNAGAHYCGWAADLD